jgi:hypothetical protein
LDDVQDRKAFEWKTGHALAACSIAQDGYAIVRMGKEDVTMSSNKPGLEIHSGITLKGQLSMVKDIVLTGRFEGDLQTLGQLTVSSGGTAVGTIEAGALVLEPGNQVEARVKVNSPGAPQPNSGLQKNAPPGKWPLSLKKLTQMALGRA